jgi:hypothetical protein
LVILAPFVMWTLATAWTLQTGLQVSLVVLEEPERRIAEFGEFEIPPTGKKMLWRTVAE